ncbi:hypothetical protein ACYZX9_06460 [Sphingomonas citri]
MLAAATGVPGSFGLVSVSLTVLTMAFAVGFISGGYSNPAVGVGLVRQLWLFRAAPLLGASVPGCSAAGSSPAGARSVARSDQRHAGRAARRRRPRGLVALNRLNGESCRPLGITD